MYFVQRSLSHVDIHTTQIYAHITNSDLQNKINIAFGTVTKRDKATTGQVSDPLHVLKLHYAHGELSEQDFAEKCELLTNLENSSVF